MIGSSFRGLLAAAQGGGDHSRLAYVEVLGDERAQTCARFWRRAHRWFALHGISVAACSATTGSAAAAGCSGRR
jgi:hypothetical protein